MQPGEMQFAMLVPSSWLLFQAALSLFRFHPAQWFLQPLEHREAPCSTAGYWLLCAHAYNLHELEVPFFFSFSILLIFLLKFCREIHCSFIYLFVCFHFST